MSGNLNSEICQLRSVIKLLLTVKIDEDKENICQFLILFVSFVLCLLMLSGILHIRSCATEAHLDQREKDRNKNDKHVYSKLYM